MTGVDRRPRNVILLNRRRVLATTGAGAGLAALSAACRGAGGRPRQAGSPGRASGSGGGQVKRGGTLHARLAADPFDFDMSKSGKSIPNPYGSGLAYETLLTLKVGPGVPYGQTVIEPGLAEHWEVSPDALTCTFQLHKGIKFADESPVNGRDLTSADVKWSFEYFSRSGPFAGNKQLGKAAFSWMFAGMDRVETPDPATAVVHFKQPSVPFLSYCHTYALPIVAHEIFDQDGSLTKRIAGTGPFQLDLASTQHGARWVFKRNPGYWQPDQPYVDEVQYLVLPDESSYDAAFQTKQIDLYTGNDPTIAQTIQKNNPSAVAEPPHHDAPYNLYMNVRKPPFNDVRVRRAVSMAIDHDEFDRTMTGGKGGWAMSGAFLDTWTQEEIKQILRYDPQGAKTLLAQAGYPNGFKTQIFSHAPYDDLKPFQLLQAQWKRAGIDAAIDQVSDKAVGAKRLYSGDFDSIILYENQYADPDSWLYGQNYSTSSGNWIGVKDSDLDRLIDAERSEVDPQKRRQRVKDASRYVAENGLSLALFARMDYSFYHPYLKNYADHWQVYDFSARNVWLEK